MSEKPLPASIVHDPLNAARNAFKKAQADTLEKSMAKKEPPPKKEK